MSDSSDLTRSIIDYLTAIRGLAWRNNTGAYRTEKRFIRYGTPGSGDVLAVVEGKFYSIEVKVGRDRLRDSQRAWIESVESAGGVCLVAHTIQDVIDYFQPETSRRK